MVGRDGRRPVIPGGTESWQARVLAGPIRGRNESWQGRIREEPKSRGLRSPGDQPVGCRSFVRCNRFGRSDCSRRDRSAFGTSPIQRERPTRATAPRPTSGTPSGNRRRTHRGRAAPQGPTASRSGEGAGRTAGPPGQGFARPGGCTPHGPAVSAPTSPVPSRRLPHGADSSSVGCSARCRRAIAGAGAGRHSGRPSRLFAATRHTETAAPATAAVVAALGPAVSRDRTPAPRRLRRGRPAASESGARSA